MQQVFPHRVGFRKVPAFEIILLHVPCWSPAEQSLANSISPSVVNVTEVSFMFTDH